MSRLASVPQHIQAYVFHGLDLKEGKQWHGECPFCTKQKFYVDPENGLWKCMVCGTGTHKGGGNVYTFLRELHKASKATGLDSLAKARGILKTETLDAWGVRQSLVTNEYIIPGYSPDGKMNQLYRYTQASSDGKMVLWATPNLGHQLFGLNLFDHKKENVYVCEGPWDSMALWEVLRSTKDTGGDLTLTSNEGLSIGGSTNVIATPGCNVFSDSWHDVVRGKTTTLVFDNDHSRTNPKSGAIIEGAGIAGVKRIAAILSQASELPKELRYLHWGDAGYDPSLPSGTDIRDLLKDKAKMVDRIRVLEREILPRMRPVPSDWVPGRSGQSAAGVPETELLPCTNWKDLIKAWRKAMKWTPGLDKALSVMLAAAASVKMQGSQLWVKIISPPSTGKTELCNGLGVNRKIVKSVGNFSGFHSGFQTDADGVEDHSLLNQLRDMVFIVKDGDTILKSPNRDKILAQARDAYDTSCAVSYGNKVKREYSNLRFIFILCGTESLLEMDSADLGARFLDCVIMYTIDEDLESEINSRTFHRLFRNRGFETNCTEESQSDEALLKARRMTGGYLAYLRENTKQLAQELSDENAEDLDRQFNNLAQFVAFMRARPSKKQEETTTREMSARLNEQLSKLGICLAVVMNRPGLDGEVMKRVRAVAMDTARGRTYDICRHLYKAKDGLDAEAISRLTNHPADKERIFLRFLRRIGAVELFAVEGSGLAGRTKWRLTDRIRKLYECVVKND